MKIDAIKLGHVLFFPYPHYLDLYTGNIYSQSVMKQETSDENQYLLLPVYTRTPIYQQYLDELFKIYGFKGYDPFGKYSRFEHRLIQMHSDMIALEYEYIDKAYHFLDGFRLEGREYNRAFPSELEYYQEFEESYTTEFAINWCQENGFEWYIGNDSANLEFCGCKEDKQSK